MIQLPSNGTAIAYEYSDKKVDRCSKQISLIPTTDTMCTIALGEEQAPWQGDDYPDDVIATCDLDLVELDVEDADLLNVCSYPSGEPNSNPFDCVITPGAGYILIQKATTPSSGETFDFTLSPASLDGTTAYTVAGDDGSGGPGSSALIPVSPGTYSLTEGPEANWNLTSVSCDDGSGTPNGTDAITGIEVSTGETVTCTFNNTWSLTGNVTYTILVTNNSLEPATLDSLMDDRFGNLHGTGDCSLTQPLAATGQAGASYTCSFVKSLTGSSGDTHTNIVTAVGKDDDGNSDTETDDATVTFTGP